MIQLGDSGVFHVRNLRGDVSIGDPEHGAARAWHDPDEPCEKLEWISPEAMKQGQSGSSVERKGLELEKRTSYRAFVHAPERQRALIALTLRLPFLPAIRDIDADLIVMEFIDGAEGITEHNADAVGESLRLLHDQTGFEYRCDTGVDWVLAFANQTLERVSSQWRIAGDLVAAFPDDALIHAEPTQVVQRHDGSIVFIDVEGIGRGSKYRDLGFVEFIARVTGKASLLERFLDGYNGDVDLSRMRQMAGLIALAYARFADSVARVELGIQMITEEPRQQSVDVFRPARTGR